MPRLEDKTQLRKELESMRYINRNFLTGKQGGGKKKQNMQELLENYKRFKTQIQETQAPSNIFTKKAYT